jgi:type I restriction enzyme S subunit
VNVHATIILPFESAVDEVSAGNKKIQKGDYLPAGLYPVVDQGQDFVGGFCNDKRNLFEGNGPWIVFGDHTRVLKYVDFPFCMGADGVKVLKPRSERAIDTKFLFYFLTANEVPSAGYSRHYKFLKRLEIPIPPLDEQRRIAAILDKADGPRRKRKRALDLHNNLTQSIFLEMFGDSLSNSMGFKISAFEPLLKTSPNFGSMIPPKTQLAEWVSLRVANIQNWTLTLDDSKYIDLPSDSVEKHSLLDGNIILARAIASEEHLGKCVVVKPAGRKWAFDSHLMRIRLNTKMINPVYVRELFRTPGGRQIFLRSTRKTTVQYNVNTKELRALKIPVPPIDLQNEFVSRVEKQESIQDFGGRSTGYLNHLFYSLQSRAFSGQL